MSSPDARGTPTDSRVLSDHVSGIEEPSTGNEPQPQPQPLRQTQTQPPRTVVPNALASFQESSNQSALKPSISTKPGTHGAVSAIPSKSSILVHPRQRGNPLLSYIKNVPWEYSETINVDYLAGISTLAVFLSLKYHLIKPRYIISRLETMPREPKLKVLLLHVDVDSGFHSSISDLTALSIKYGCTLICAYTPAEAARYLELLKSYEHKSASSIQERIENTYLSRAQDALTTIKSVNKTDTVTLLSHFGSIANIIKASQEELAEPVGIGETKLRRLHAAFNTPFLGGDDIGYE